MIIYSVLYLSECWSAAINLNSKKYFRMVLYHNIVRVMCQLQLLWSRPPPVENGTALLIQWAGLFHFNRGPPTHVVEIGCAHHDLSRLLSVHKYYIPELSNLAVKIIAFARIPMTVSSGCTTIMCRGWISKLYLQFTIWYGKLISIQNELDTDRQTWDDCWIDVGPPSATLFKHKFIIAGVTHGHIKYDLSQDVAYMVDI